MDRSTQTFFPPTWEWLSIFKSFSYFWCVDPFRRYSRSKSKDVKNAQNFGRFFCRHKFFGAGIVKIVPKLSPTPRGTSTEKSPVRILPLARKLFRLTRWILGQILNFRDQNFFLGGTPSRFGVCASKAWSVFSACKTFRAQHPRRAKLQSPEKKIH